MDGCLVSFCLTLVLVGITLLIACIVYEKTRTQILPMIAVFIVLGLFGYLFQFLNIILIDVLD